MAYPDIQVGIMTAPEIDFNLHGLFSNKHLSDKATGKQHVIYKDGYIEDTFSGESYKEMCFTPEKNHDFFELQRVTIGIDFHWERTEAQSFKGALKIIPDNGQLVAINIIDIEQYLQSVISSEMNASASLEFLKTHAIISRSWLIAQLKKEPVHTDPPGDIWARKEWIQWFDRETHSLFDVCADDHCQRYQGITRIISPMVREAVESTCGMVLSYENEVCDARFHKCCGGMTESFENIWEPVHHPYLVNVRDYSPAGKLAVWDLSDEDEAWQWIRGKPEAFCDTKDVKVLKQVLNDYDLETKNFFRWEVTYTQEELSALIYKKSGIDFGRIVDLVPVIRGGSGRISRLWITGTKCDLSIGKELLIRRFLSPTHLYSSAFVVKRKLKNNYAIPVAFTLYGAGWGHGAGLCQIGAAVMCSKGYTSPQILGFYYPRTTITQLYE